MVEFVTAAFAPINVVFTVLLLLTGLYWITVIVGLLDVDIFNIEVPDSGLEPGADVDVDGDVAVDGDVSFLRSFLHFFYVGEVPTMVLVSILALSLWAFSMLANYYFNPSGSLLMATPIFIANLLFSAFVMKVCAVPLRSLYRMLNKDYNAPGRILGRIGKVITTQVSQEKMGQVEVPTKGAPIVLNVLSQDEHVFTKDEEAVVVEKDDARGIYLIAPVDLEK